MRSVDSKGERNLESKIFIHELETRSVVICTAADVSSNIYLIYCCEGSKYESCINVAKQPVKNPSARDGSVRSLPLKQA